MPLPSTRSLVGIGAALVLGGAGLFALRSSEGATPASLIGTGEAGDLVRPDQADIRKQLTSVMSSVQTKVISTSGTRAHLVQLVNGVRHEVAVRADPVELHLSPMTVPLRTVTGEPFYPAQFEFSPLPGGYRTDLAVFIREEDLAPDVLAVLKPERVARDEPPSVILAAFRAPQFAGVPGILVQATTTSTSGSGADLGNTMIRNQGHDPAAFDKTINTEKKAPDLDSVKAQERATKKFEELVEQLKKEGRHIDDILREGDKQKILEREQEALERTGKKWSKLGTLLGQGASILELLRAVQQLNAGLGGLNSLRDCLHNPVAPTAKRALKEDPAVKRTEESLDEAGTDLTIIAAARVSNSIAHATAAKALEGSPAQMALILLQMAAEAMLTDTQDTVLSDVASGVVPCETRWVMAEVISTMTEAMDKPSFESEVTEFLSARILFGVKCDGYVEEAGGWGEYRWAHSGTDHCAVWSHTVNGRAATYLSGSPNGFKEVQRNGKKERVGAFDIAVNAEQNDLVMVSAPGRGEMERGASGSYVCKPTPAMRSEGASANASCSFEGVTPTIGGVFYSNIEESGAAEPGKTVQRSCRLVLRPLAVKPPPDPRDPPPPPRR
jgi:hypothetical protein